MRLSVPMMKSIIMLLILGIVLIGTVYAAPSQIQSSQEQLHETKQVVLNYFIGLLSATKRAIENGEKIDEKSLAPVYLNLVRKIVPAIGKDFIDPNNKLGQTIFKALSALVSVWLKNAEIDAGGKAQFSFIMGHPEE